MSGDRIDWRDTTAGERRCLSKPVNLLRRKLDLNWQQLFEQAFGERDHVGAGYQDNLRQGRIAPEKAWKLFDWLAARDEGIADSVTEAILAHRSHRLPAAPATWNTLLDMGSFKGIRALKIVPSLSALDFARRHPISPIDVALSEEFAFEIDAPIAGRVIAFHGRRDQWSQVPMSRTSAIVRIDVGTAVLPRGKDGDADPLHEDAEAGQHSFAFVIFAGEQSPLPKSAPKAGRILRPDILNQIAQAFLAVPESDRHIVRINLIFKPHRRDF